MDLECHRQAARRLNLATDAPEATKGFLLNHVISELLPAQADGYRYANSDPVTGQAAWYDLRVRVTKASDQDVAVSQPQFDVLTPPDGLAKRPGLSRYGKMFRGKRERQTS